MARHGRVIEALIGALKKTVGVITREEDEIATVDDFFVWVEGEREIR